MGINHDKTKKLEPLLAMMRWRKVSIKTESRTKGYVLLRYEGAGNEKCVVQDPSAEPRNFAVNTKDVVALPGTPVISRQARECPYCFQSNRRTITLD